MDASLGLTRFTRAQTRRPIIAMAETGPGRRCCRVRETTIVPNGKDEKNENGENLINICKCASHNSMLQMEERKTDIAVLQTILNYGQRPSLPATGRVEQQRLWQ